MPRRRYYMNNKDRVFLSRMRRMQLYRPTLFYSIIEISAAALLLFAAHRYLATSFYWSWYLSINLVTFCFYGYDKFQSMRDDAWRVPELALHLASLAGGCAGAFLGRLYYRHKTQKPVFMLIIILSVILHTALYFLI